MKSRMRWRRSKDFRIGPMYTPPSVGGTIVMPGAIGGAGWGGGAFDPSTGTIYIKATNQPALYKIIQPARSDRSTPTTPPSSPPEALRVVMPSTDSLQRMPPLPINKPPYGTLVAIDLNTGATKWNVTLGESYRAFTIVRY